MGLTVGEARERGPRFVREGSLLLARDGAADLVFHGKVERIPVEDLVVPEPTEDMVQRRNISLKRWFPTPNPSRVNQPHSKLLNKHLPSHPCGHKGGVTT